MEVEPRYGLLSLPYDAITLILMKLSTNDLHRAASINKVFHKLCNQNLVWKHRYFMDYKIDSINYEGDWKDLYKKMKQPMTNLKNKSFVYRVTSKTLRKAKKNSLFNADWNCIQNSALLRWTQRNRASYGGNEVLSMDLMDLNNLSCTPIPFPSPYMSSILMENYIAIFQDDEGVRTVSIFNRKELDLTGNPLYVLRWTADNRRPEYFTTGKYFFDALVTEEYEAGWKATHISANIYDFENSGDTPISNFSISGNAINVWNLTDDYIVYTRTKECNEVRVFEWRKVNGASEEKDMTFIHDHIIRYVAILDHKLLCYETGGSGTLTLWDIKTQQKIKQFATFPVVNSRGISVIYQHNWCCITLEITNQVYKHAFFDLDREELISAFEFYGENPTLKPLMDEHNRFSGKFLVLLSDNDGILELCHPLMELTFDVLIIPPTEEKLSSIDATTLARRSVTYGQMLASFVDICQCPNSLFLDSHVVFLQPKKKRYTLIFNGKHVEKVSTGVTDFVRKSSIEHYRNTPVHGLEFGLDTIQKPPPIRYDWRRNTPDAPLASGLTVYGPCILMKEVWSDAHGFIPKSIGKKFNFKFLTAEATL